MISRAQWEAHKEAPLELEKFLKTNTGVMLMDCLASCMIIEKGSQPHSASLIEATAISGAEDNGYRRCYQNIMSLMDSSVRSKKESRVSGEPALLPGQTLPAKKEILDRINQDPIYAKRMAGQ